MPHPQCVRAVGVWFRNDAVLRCYACLLTDVSRRRLRACGPAKDEEVNRLDDGLALGRLSREVPKRRQACAKGVIRELGQRS